MNTRKALGIFSGRDGGDTFLSDPRAVEHFSRAAAEKQAGIRQRQQEPHVSLPHVRLAADRAQEAARAAMLDSTAPLVDKFSAYQTAKKHASQSGADGGLRALSQHLRVQWEGDPDGFFSASDIVRLRDHFSRSFGRTAAVDVLSNAIPRAGVGDLPVRRLAQMATQIRSQSDYESICRRAGLDGSRPEQVRARAYLRALVRRAAEGDDVMQVDVIEQQGAQLSGIPSDDGGGVLSGADPKITQLHAQASLPTARQVMTAVLDANVVKLAGYSLFINDRDQVELRTPRGASRAAPISKLASVVRDFLHVAQAANFEPSVNTQQEPYVDIDETEGGDVIGKDSTSDESATNAIVPSGKPKVQHPMQSNSGTSASEKALGADSAGNDPAWGNPALSGPHASDPHDQSGTSFSERSLGPDHQQDTPGWENPGPIITSREGRLDDSAFLVGNDPAERYRRARENRPSVRLLEGIADEQGWLARRVLAQFEGDDEGKGDEAQTPGADVLKEAASTTVRLRDDVFQIGDGFADRTADAKYVYTFGYDQQHGQPRLSEMQRYVDTCCGGVHAYRVASLSQVSPGVLRATVIEAQGSTFDGGADVKRTAVRRAMGKSAIDHGNDSEGMGSDYAGTILGKEGAGKMVPNPNPKGRSEMVTESYARAWKAQHGQGDGKAPSSEHEQRMQEYEQSEQQARTPKLGPGPQESPRDDTGLQEELEQAGWAQPSESSEDEYDPYEDESMIEFPNEDVQAEAAFAGQDMLDWNEGQGSAIYAVGSSLMAGNPVPMSLLAQATDRIDTFLGEESDDAAAEKLMSISETLHDLMNRGRAKPAAPAAPAAPAEYPDGSKLTGQQAKEWADKRPVKTGPEVDSLTEKLLANPQARSMFSMFSHGQPVEQSTKKYIGKNIDDFKRAYESVKHMPSGSAKLKAFTDAANSRKPAGNHDYPNELAPILDVLSAPAQPGEQLPLKFGSVLGVPSVNAPSGPHEGTQTSIKPVTDVPSVGPKGQPSPPKQGARISEGWGDGGDYKRDIEAESAQEVWELHRGLGGAAPDFKALQQQQQEAQMSAPVEPRPDASGKVRLPEPEPESLNAEQQVQSAVRRK